MPDPQRYTKHLDTVLALISNLALTTKGDYSLRTVAGLAMDLGRIGEEDTDSIREEIRETLNEFPGFFRKTRSRSGDHLYTLHLRRALAPDPDRTAPPPLPVDLLNALLEFVSKQAEAEATANQFRANISVTQRQLWVTMAGAVIAAVAAVLAFAGTFIPAILKH